MKKEPSNLELKLQQQIERVNAPKSEKPWAGKTNRHATRAYRNALAKQTEKVIEGR